jgi:hypothetical protein
VVFWRRNQEAWARRLKSLFDPAIGITHELFRVDTLHTLALGVYKTYVHAATWALLDSEIYSHGPIYSAAEKHQLNAQRLRYELWAFYDASLPTASRVPDFRVEMFGARGSNQVHAKGAQTEGLLAFVVAKLAGCAARVPHGPAYLGAGRALLAYKEVLAHHGQRVSANGYQDRSRPQNIKNNATPSPRTHSHRSTTRKLGRPWRGIWPSPKPRGIPTQMKHHLWVHMTDRTSRWWAEQHTATNT